MESKTTLFQTIELAGLLTKYLKLNALQKWHFISVSQHFVGSFAEEVCLVIVSSGTEYQDARAPVSAVRHQFGGHSRPWRLTGPNQTRALAQVEQTGQCGLEGRRRLWGRQLSGVDHFTAIVPGYVGRRPSAIHRAPQHDHFAGHHRRSRRVHSNAQRSNLDVEQQPIVKQGRIGDGLVGLAALGIVVQLPVSILIEVGTVVPQDSTLELGSQIVSTGNDSRRSRYSFARTSFGQGGSGKRVDGIGGWLVELITVGHITCSPAILVGHTDLGSQRTRPIVPSKLGNGASPVRGAIEHNGRALLERRYLSVAQHFNVLTACCCCCVWHLGRWLRGGGGRSLIILQ